jgi:predicted ArsR family transcriptional regulator
LLGYKKRALESDGAHLTRVSDDHATTGEVIAEVSALSGRSAAAVRRKLIRLEEAGEVTPIGKLVTNQRGRPQKVWPRHETIAAVISAGSILGRAMAPDQLARTLSA